MCKARHDMQIWLNFQIRSDLAKSDNSKSVHFINDLKTGKLLQKWMSRPNEHTNCVIAR